MPRITIITCLFILLSSCRRDNSTAVSFYYWKTIFHLTDDEKKVLNHNEASKLYVRYFDVVLKHGKAFPLSAITFNESPGQMNIVPVVYIKNEVMLEPELNVKDLAQKVLSHIEQINVKYAIPNKEIQIDCDWTRKSKATYFQFIHHIKELSKKTISVTIRLHQVKYHRDTGVPPVDRGVLMYYNMGRIGPDSSNSIYDRATAKRYIGNLKNYPMDLDIALPVFSWGIHIRYNKVIDLLGKTDAGTFTEDDHFELHASGFIDVKEDVIRRGRYFKKGDRIKIESVSEDDLENMMADLSGGLGQRPHEIIFFDLDQVNLKHYQYEKKFFQKISSDF